MKCTKCGGIYKDEYAERCGHRNASDPTTLQEQADYVQYQVDIRIKIAKNIFGNGIFLGGAGEFIVVNDKDIRGTYQSSSGRVYIEWIQDSGTTWGNLKCYGGTMAGVGCPVYAGTMLLNSIGLDVNPGDVLKERGTTSDSPKKFIQKVLNKYNINKEAVVVHDRDTYISKLLEGYGFVTWVGKSSPFTDYMHFIVCADIRTTQLGSYYGYDVFVLSSSTTGLGEKNRWHPIESVIDNLQKSGSYGTYISD